MLKVGIVDYGSGNIGSIINAFRALGITPTLLSDASKAQEVDCFVLPGVGSFSESKKLLDSTGWTNKLENEVRQLHKPLLGICLGMQLLADLSTENARDANGTPGLGFISGRVENLTILGCNLRVPHVGWNSVTIARESDLLRDISSETDFYFVHSYAFVPNNQNQVLATVQYDITVPVVICQDRIWGVQFHPEKSSRAGLKILSNFVDIAKC